MTVHAGLQIRTSNGGRITQDAASSWHQRELAKQVSALRDGTALAGHCASAHNGSFNEQCAACVELRGKQERYAG